MRPFPAAEGRGGELSDARDAGARGSRWRHGRPCLDGSGQFLLRLSAFATCRSRRRRTAPVGEKRCRQIHLLAPGGRVFELNGGNVIRSRGYESGQRTSGRSDGLAGRTVRRTERIARPSRPRAGDGASTSSWTRSASIRPRSTSPSAACQAVGSGCW